MKKKAKVRITIGKKAVAIPHHRAKVIYHPVAVELSPIEVEHTPVEEVPPVSTLEPYVEPFTPPVRKRGFWKWLTGNR
jgi:hypothetical protein